jgi:acid phosphatase
MFFFKPLPAVLALVMLFLQAQVQLQNDIPQYDHVIIVMEENHAFYQIIGSANAPFINHLAKDGVLFTNSHAIGHPSQPNYLALFSGSTQGISGDDCLQGKTPFHTPNLAAALIDRKFTFRGYAQNMPKAGYLDCTAQASDYTIGHLYARKHCPWVNWLGTGVNTIPPACSLPMNDFPKDFSKLPTLAFAVPDMDNDMHNIGLFGDDSAIRRGDTWLKNNLGEYAEWAKKHNSLLIVTWDEDNYSDKNQNKIATIFYGAKLLSGKYNMPINHYNLLHTLESMYGLPFTDINNAPPIAGVWGK